MSIIHPDPVKGTSAVAPVHGPGVPLTLFPREESAAALDRHESIGKLGKHCRMVLRMVCFYEGIGAKGLKAKAVHWGEHYDALELQEFRRRLTDLDRGSPHHPLAECNLIETRQERDVNGSCLFHKSGRPKLIGSNGEAHYFPTRRGLQVNRGDDD